MRLRLPRWLGSWLCNRNLHWFDDRKTVERHGMTVSTCARCHIAANPLDPRDPG